MRLSITFNIIDSESPDLSEALTRIVDILEAAKREIPGMTYQIIIGLGGEDEDRQS